MRRHLPSGIVGIICIVSIMFIMILYSPVKKQKRISMPEEIQLIEPGDHLVCDSVSEDTIYMAFDLYN